MIVPMKKVTVVVQAKDADSAIKSLASLGFLHVQHAQPPAGEDVGAIKDDIAILNTALGILSQPEFSRSGAKQDKKTLTDWKFCVKHIIDLHKRLDQLEEYSRNLENKINQWAAWGDFEPQSIIDLREKGVYVRLYQIPNDEVASVSGGVVVKKISVHKGIADCVIISQEKTDVPFTPLHPESPGLQTGDEWHIKLESTEKPRPLGRGVTGFTEVVLPKIGLDKMRARLKEDSRAKELIRKNLINYAGYINCLSDIKLSLEKKLEFCEAYRGMGTIEKLMYLTGYAPFDAEKSLLKTSEKESLGIIINDPCEGDAVPTLIRNPRWVSIISPVFKLLEILPGYHELDISPLFLCFLSLFFGMIIGDAGYGAVYFILTFWLHKQFSKKLQDKRIFFLLYIFSACAIFWGIVTGTFFGQEWYVNAGLKPLIPILNNTNFLQAFCFFIGAFHLTLAHGWQAVRKLPNLAAFSDIGWICVLWAAFFLSKTLILNDPFPYLGKWLIVIGLILVIFCTSPQKNVLKMIGQGLATVALSLMNNFTDVVSYVRLFAVGLAGVAIADTVNTLASSVGGGNYIAKAIIILLGHTINIILGPMSVLVHGLRLNVLEFSSHAGLSWSGIAYKPLKE